METPERPIDTVIAGARDVLAIDLDDLLGDATRQEWLRGKLTRLRGDAKAMLGENDQDANAIVEAYAVLVTGLATFTGDQNDTSLPIIADAASVLFKGGYKVDAFKTNLLLCTAYHHRGDEESALSQGLLAFERGSEIGQKELARFRNWKQMRLVCDFLLGHKHLIRDGRPSILLLSEKLLTINKNARPDEYKEVKDDLFLEIEKYIKKLLAKKQIDAALSAMRDYKLTVDLFLREISDIVITTQNSTDFGILCSLMRLFDLPEHTPYATSALASWRAAVTRTMSVLVSENPLLLLEAPERRSIVELVGADASAAFMERVIGLTEVLVDDPQHEATVALLSLIHDEFHATGRVAEAGTIEMIMQATLQVRRIQRTPESYAPALARIFEETCGRFAPMALIRGYYNATFAPHDKARDLAACNALAQFVGLANDTVLSFPNSGLKNKLLTEVVSITETLTRCYQDAMQHKMAGLTLDVLLGDDPRAPVTTVVGDSVPMYPLPFIEALDALLAGWRRLPLLEDTQYEQDGQEMADPPAHGSFRVVTRKMRPVCWLVPFKDVFITLIVNVQRATMRSQAFQNRILTRAIIAHLNFMHRIFEGTAEEPDGPHGDIRAATAAFLRSLSAVGLASETAKERLVNLSEWRDAATPALWRSQEAPDKCGSCGYSLPPGVMTCPSCKTGVPPASLGKTVIGLGHARDHIVVSTVEGFNAPPKDPVTDSPATADLVEPSPELVHDPRPDGTSLPSAVPPPPSQEEGGPVQRCPKCGGLVSDETNECVACGTGTH